MGIQIKTPNSSIIAHFDKQYEERVRKVIVNVLQYVGEACIREARDSGNYMDQTGNLRSSIGYVVVVDGKIVGRGAAPVTKDGASGAEETRKHLTQVAKEYNGMTLIVCAGMKYAFYVETRGYNVLTSAELLADRLVPQMLTQLGFIKK